VVEGQKFLRPPLINHALRFDHRRASSRRTSVSRDKRGSCVRKPPFSFHGSPMGSHTPLPLRRGECVIPSVSHTEKACHSTQVHRKGDLPFKQVQTENSTRTSRSLQLVTQGHHHQPENAATCSTQLNIVAKAYEALPNHQLTLRRVFARFSDVNRRRPRRLAAHRLSFSAAELAYISVPHNLYLCQCHSGITIPLVHVGIWFRRDLNSHSPGFDSQRRTSPGFDSQRRTSGYLFFLNVRDNWHRQRQW